MKKTIVAVVALLALVGSNAYAGGKMTRLGEDPALDGPPALDVTFLDVGRAGSNLEIRIGVNGMFPGIGGYPTLPGIEWIFKSGSRTFLAEAYVNNTRGAFLLFELEGDTYRQLADLEGTYDSADGYISMLVPLKMIGAKKGSHIMGAGPDDVDAHVHFGVTTYYSDKMTTVGHYQVR